MKCVGFREAENYRFERGLQAKACSPTATPSFTQSITNQELRITNRRLRRRCSFFIEQIESSVSLPLVAAKKALFFYQASQNASSIYFPLIARLVFVPEMNIATSGGSVFRAERGKR